MTKIRCSSLPLFMSCSNSVTNPDYLLSVEQEFEAAETGTLIHRLAEAYIKEGVDNVDHYADRLRMLDGYDRAHELFPNIQRVWKLARGTFKEPKIERYLESPIGMGPNEDVVITGHIDVSEIGEDAAYVLDWKTGRVRDDHYHQMAGYAYLVYAARCASALGPVNDYVVYCTVCYADDGSFYKYSFTADQLNEWGDDVVAQVENQRYVYNKRCVYCPLSTTCEAYQAKARTAVATIMGETAVSLLRDMPNKDRAEVLQKLKIVETAVKNFRSELKADVKVNGPLPTGDGREYVIKRTRNRHLNTSKALTVLNNHLTDAEIFDCTSIGLAKAEASVKKRADKGMKTAAAQALNDDLHKAGAVFYTEVDRMETRKITKEIK